MNGRRFHILYCLRLFRYALLLCLVPMVQALIAFDWTSLFTALKQDAAILLFFLAVSLVRWYVTGFALTQDSFEAQTGVFVHSKYTFSKSSVAVLEIVRPLYCRLLGASRVTLYFHNYAAPRRFQCYLTKRDAQALADLLMPVRQDHSIFSPTGYEKLSFVMLSANVITACAFAWVSLDRIQEVLGDSLRQLAWMQFEQIELLVERILPAGLAALATLFFLVGGLTFLYAFLHTAGFRVCRNGGIIISKGGLVTKTERRVRLRCVSACDIRVTPAGRLLRRYPVFIAAGSFTGGEVPLFVVKKGQEARVEALLPGYSKPDGPLCDPARKSPVQYLWKPGALLALGLALCGVAFNVLPGVLPVLAAWVLGALGCMIVSLEGLRREGLHKNENRTLSVVFTRFFTRHEVCVLTQDLAYTLFEHPFSVSEGRCDVTVCLPCRVRYKARGVLQYQARSIPFSL